MSRYIDFYLIGELVDSHGNVHYEDLKNLPAADVVEVVRCKDCRYRDKVFDFGRGGCMNPKGLKRIVYENNYCCHGKRREDE